MLKTRTLSALQPQIHAEAELIQNIEDKFDPA
jgi:hypothetical protein